MELLTLSKFKLQLRALVTEVRDLREREHQSTEQLQLVIQRSEEEFSRKLQELQAELDSSIELQQKLERKIRCLQDDNALLENKQRDLKGTIDSLLQSRESFVSIYEDSTCEMRRSIELKERKLSVLSEKLCAHFLLFESIEKEAASVRQLVDNVHQLVSEKEDVVAGLKMKLEQVSALDKEFIDKICFLENRLKNVQDELQRKDMVIIELERQLEAAKTSITCQPQIGELQKTLSIKEDIIENLLAEKKALYFEVRNMEMILQKIQDAVTCINAEDKKVFCSVLEDQEESSTMSKKEGDGMYYLMGVILDISWLKSGLIIMVQESRKDSPCKDPDKRAVENTAVLCHEHNSVDNLHENCNFDSCMSEVVYSPPQPDCSGLQLDAKVLNISIAEKKNNCLPPVSQ
ncbi:PREDICTED: coiled-coil domain-containing protein 136 isoform X2 [Nelumbo nucifera]|uniref:Coiled-coil domain-containing protein 136 isoform X2 n=1 Tax=Nelumbo nucifera TaxID=4432 RepID=A0A1U8Q5N8_NELNU|nr:PREDICTED: coiled-coil domain-containing protein 136 isoform X2 [Nelumbo nucifera]